MSRYICTLPKETQIKIQNLLIEAKLTKADIETAMDSRISDLEDTIKIQRRHYMGNMADILQI